MSDVAMQLQSDLLGVDVERSASSETIAWGAALAAGLDARREETRGLPIMAREGRGAGDRWPEHHFHPPAHRWAVRLPRLAMWSAGCS